MHGSKTKRVKVTFDKTELRSRLQKFTFREARRHDTNLYQTLVQELLEEGCLTSAKYFHQYASKELDLYSNTVIRDRVIDYPKLLMSLFDNCKMAERSAYLEQDKGLTVTFKLLYQVMCMLGDPQYVVKLSWLIKEAYQVIVRICDKVGPGKPNVDRPIAEIYLKYANHLMKETDTMPSALNYFEKSLALVRTNDWIVTSINPETRTFSYLHVLVVHDYVSALLKFGVTIATSDHLRAVDLAQQAVCTLTQAGHKSKNLHHFVNAKLYSAEFYIEGEEYKMAFKVLLELEADMPNIMDEYVEPLLLRLHLNKGICYTTQLDSYKSAIMHLQMALKLSEKLNNREKEAETYMCIGKVYLYEGAKQLALAKNAFCTASKIYQELGNMKARKRIFYLLAQVMNATIFPLLIDLMKKSDKYCDFFYLRQWKNHLSPFWHGQYLRDNENYDSPRVLCLMEEFEKNKNVRELVQL